MKLPDLQTMKAALVEREVIENGEGRSE